VARRLLQGGASLVGRVVSTPEEAASAATEGASVVLWQVQLPVLNTIRSPLINADSQDATAAMLLPLPVHPQACESRCRKCKC